MNKRSIGTVMVDNLLSETKSVFSNHIGPEKRSNSTDLLIHIFNDVE
jgi:hypothetical protein